MVIIHPMALWVMMPDKVYKKKMIVVFKQSFMIFCMHMMGYYYLRISFSKIGLLPSESSLSIEMSIIMVLIIRLIVGFSNIICCLGISVLLNLYLPRLYGIISGWRGFGGLYYKR